MILLPRVSTLRLNLEVKTVGSLDAEFFEHGLRIKEISGSLGSKHHCKDSRWAFKEDCCLKVSFGCEGSLAFAPPEKKSQKSRYRLK